MRLKKFNQFNSNNWIGPVEILHIEGDNILTNLGRFKNPQDLKLTKGYSYLLRLEDGDVITETGMSCVDLVIFAINGIKFFGSGYKESYKVLSIKRGKDPFKDMWANPGGNIDEGEEPIDAAIRELWEETGIHLDEGELKYVGKFDKPWRDPRNKNCVSHAFMMVVNGILETEAGDDAKECEWIDVDHNGDVDKEMAFDHAEIIKKAFQMI